MSTRYCEFELPLKYVESDRKYKNEHSKPDPEEIKPVEEQS
jgi:hypothetical protein